MATTAFIPVGRAIEILSRVEPGRLLWNHSTTQIAIGKIPTKPEYFLDLGSETLEIAPSDGSMNFNPFRAVERAGLLRHSGRYLFDMKGKTLECGSLKELLKKGLLAIEAESPGMLEELTKEKPRTKRIVARNPKDLFTDSPALVKQFAEPLTEGWYYGTNNSGPETKSWLARACAIAKLRWGVDFDTSL